MNCLDAVLLVVFFCSTGRGSAPQAPPRIWDVERPIQYAFNGNFNDLERQAVAEAVALWSVGTCIRFEEVSYYPERRSVINIERTTRRQFGQCGPQDPNTLVTPMRVSADFLADRRNIGPLAHEFGHALGLRDQYFLIWGLVEGTPYDPTSIMHYSGVEFSLDSRNLLTMVSYDPDQEGVMGNQQVPVFNDYKILNLHFNCPGIKCQSYVLPSPCQNSGYQDPNDCSKCLCPPGVSGTFCDRVESSVGFQQQCGGVIAMDRCSSTTLTLPNYPFEPYPYNASCTWVINSQQACNLEVAFEEMPRIQCFVNAAHKCLDYVEIRSDFSHLDEPGKFFCTCSSTAGRRILIQGGVAMIRFRSFTDRRDRDYRGNGFKLVVRSSCFSQPRSSSDTSCKITQNGYDVNDANMPFCGGVEPRDYSISFDDTLPTPRSGCV